VYVATSRKRACAGDRVAGGIKPDAVRTKRAS
jgi:hypothetical protein